MFSDLDYKLLQLMADGRFHSGSSLGRELGISRAAIWQHMQQLQQFGIVMHAVAGRGYCLDKPLDLLEPAEILRYLDMSTAARLAPLQLIPVLNSTNAHVRSQSLPEHQVLGCLAEYQSDGRGRAGRHWVSPFASNIYLSIGWRFESGTAQLAGLSLAVAVALSRALSELGLPGLAIKWPNDLFVGGEKIAGILVEASGEMHGPCTVVIGVGVNVHMDDHQADVIDQPWTDLHRCGVRVSRNLVAATVLRELLGLTGRFSEQGFAAFMKEWQALDLTFNRQVVVREHDRVSYGIAKGVDPHGLLLVEQDGHTVRYASGDISLRLQT